MNAKRFARSRSKTDRIPARRAAACTAFALLGVTVVACSSDAAKPNYDQAASALGGAIEVENVAKVPTEIDALLDLSGKVAKLMSNVNTGVSVATTALTLLGILQDAGAREEAQFAAIRMQLTALGVALVKQPQDTDRETRLTDMRTYINNVNQFAGRSGTGSVDERSLSQSESVQLGGAKIDSQKVAQNAGIDAAFRGFFDESATDGEWKNWIYERPDHSDSLVFDWRLGLAEVMELIASRLTIIGVTSPDNFQSRSEYAVELNQYRDTLQALYDKMVNDGIRCGVGKNDPLTTVCADIHTGLAVKTQVTEPTCGKSYSAWQRTHARSPFCHRPRRLSSTLAASRR